MFGGDPRESFGEGLTATYYFDVMDYAGSNVLNSGEHTGTLSGAIAAAMAALAGATTWFIVVRDTNGVTVHSEGSDANAGQGKEPPVMGEGGAGEAGEGAGEEGAVSFRFTLTGYKWVWDDKTGHPARWTGHPTEPVLGETGGYGSASDALAAGKAVGDADTTIMKVTVTATPAGFAGASHVYTDRLQAAINAKDAELAEAYKQYTGDGGTLVLPAGEPAAGPPVNLDDAVAFGATVMLGLAIVILGWHMLKGAGK